MTAAIFHFMSPRAASILNATSKLMRSEFEDACELRFRERGGVSAKSARFFAKTAVSELLSHYGIAFGAPGFLWTLEAARDLADAEIKCWRDCDGA